MERSLMTAQRYLYLRYTLGAYPEPDELTEFDRLVRTESAMAARLTAAARDQLNEKRDQR